MAKNVSIYLGLGVTSNHTIFHREYLFVNVNDYLFLNAKKPEFVQAVKGLIEVIKDCGHIIGANNNDGKTMFSMPANKIDESFLSNLFDIATGLKQMATLQGKSLSDFFDVKGFEMHDVYLECSVDTVINGSCIYNKDYTKKMVNIGEHSLSDILELDTSLVTFGHVSRAKLSSSDWIPYTEEELNGMLRADLLELALRMNLDVNSSTTKPNIIKAILGL